MDTSTAAHVPVGRYNLNADASTIAFTTRHMFGAGAVRGTFTVGSAQARVDDAGAALDATIDAASFTSGDGKRDTKVKSATFLDTGNHPTITFHAEGALPQSGEWVMEGTLTVRGKSAPLALTVTSWRPEGDAFVVSATTKVDRYAFGVTAMKGMAARYLTLDISAQFSRLG